MSREIDTISFIGKCQGCEDNENNKYSSINIDIIVSDVDGGNPGYYCEECFIDLISNKKFSEYTYIVNTQRCKKCDNGIFVKINDNKYCLSCFSEKYGLKRHQIYFNE
jgi:hypothetical protein